MPAINELQGIKSLKPLGKLNRELPQKAKAPAGMIAAKTHDREKLRGNFKKESY